MIKFRKLKYRHKLTVIILLFSILPIVIFSIFLFGRIWESNVESVLSKYKNQLDNSASAVDILFSSYVEKLLYINNNYHIINFLGTKEDLNLVGSMSFNEYLRNVIGAMKTENLQTDIVIYTFYDIGYDSGYLRGIEKFEDQGGKDGKSLKDEIMEYEDGKILWKLIKFKNSYDSTAIETDYLCLYKKILFINKPPAIIEIRIPFKQIIDRFNYEIPRNSFILYDQENSTETITVKSESMSKESVLEIVASRHINESESGYHIIERELKYGTSRLSIFIPKDYIYKNLNLYLITVALIILFITAVVFIAVKFVSVSLTRRLQELLTDMNTSIESLVKNDRLQIYKAEDEFGTIGSRFNELVCRIKEYYKKNTKYEFEKRILETELLQERINPHFLYNTLSTMRWICSDQKVINALDSLVKYYRIALNKGSSIVKISHELEMIEEYLRLQKFAYGYVFEFQITIDDGVREYLILKHMLQPIAENAVLHGINECEEGGMIKINCKMKEEKIVFEISDNGQGMEKATIDKLLSGKTESYGGYGIHNVQKRMETFYGEGFGLDIKSIVNHGTTVVMEIPCHLNADIQDWMKN